MLHGRLSNQTSVRRDQAWCIGITVGSGYAAYPPPAPAAAGQTALDCAVQKPSRSTKSPGLRLQALRNLDEHHFRHPLALKPVGTGPGTEQTPRGRAEQ